MKITMIWNKFSKEFKEKLLILIVTSLVTGILIPIITAQVGEVRAEREKKLEAELKHQASIIQDQNELLKRLQQNLIDFLYRMSKVAWYKTHDNDEAKYRENFTIYDQMAWEFHAHMKKELINARRLASTSSYQAVLHLYNEIHALDEKLVQCSQKSDVITEDWEELFQELTGKMNEVGDLIVRLAHDFDIKAF